MVCLNSKVSTRIRRRFKIHAAQHDMTMTELLQLLDSCLNSGDDGGCPTHKTRNKEITISITCWLSYMPNSSVIAKVLRSLARIDHMEEVVKEIILALLGCSICSYAFANSSVYGTVINIRVDSTGHGMVTFNATISGSPSCINSAAYGNAYAFDATTDGGRSFLELALASQASGASIAAYGLGTCSTYGGFAEDFYYGVNT